MENTAYLGIDVAKGSADFLRVNARKETLEEGFILDDCTQGRRVLTQLIDGWFAGGSPIYIAGWKAPEGTRTTGSLCFAALPQPFKKRVKHFGWPG